MDYTPKILLFTDIESYRNASTTPSQLSAEAEVIIAKSVDEAISLFDTCLPSLIIFTFDKARDAEDNYIQLFKGSSYIHVTPYKTLLLCSSEQAQIAFSSCQKGVFDDYFIDKPLLDVKLLRWAVIKLLSLVKQQSQTPITSFDKTTFDQVDTTVGSLFGGLGEAGNIYTQAKSGLQSLSEKSSTEKHQPESNNQVQFKDEFSAVTEPFFNAQERWLTTTQQTLDSLDSATKKIRQQAGIDKAKILVADDQPQFLEMIVDILEESGYVVISAKNGLDAITEIILHQPDLVLMDYDMPGLNGTEIVKQINKTLGQSTIPFIMLTGHGTQDIVSLAVEAGAVDFIVKPIRRSLLLNKINTHLPSN